MSEVLIKVENVSKKFCKDLKKSLKYGLQDLGGTMFSGSQERNLRTDEFWAVKDISFEVKRGECLGLIGHNGAGKSTLLKMLNGLIMPDSGEIVMKGKVGALIELGAGFNPILTGRENIFNNAAVLGFSKQETLDKLDEIIAFSEIEEFLDMPVQNYSSGMRVRLGFAVAAHMQPDILLIDEVLAVGDIGFVLKCFNRMDKLLQNTAMIFVSHSMPQVARMATKLLMMDKGHQFFYDVNVSDGLSHYYNSFQLASNNDFLTTKRALLKKISIWDNKSSKFQINNCMLVSGDDLVVEIIFHVLQKIEKPIVTLALYDIEQRAFAEIYGFENILQPTSFDGNVILNAKIKAPPLSQGMYSIMVFLGEALDTKKEAILRIQSAINFTVHSKHHAWCPILFDAQWQIINK